MLNSMKFLGMKFLNSFAVTLQRRLPNSAAYMERQKMAVGPFLFPLWYAIAHQNTLALGSFTATMRLGWAQLLQDYL